MCLSSELSKNEPGGRGSSSWVGSASACAQAKELRYNPLDMDASELLAQGRGLGADSMLLLALKSSRSERAVVLDVSSGADYYAPGMAYHCFTGRDCSRGLSLTSLKPEHHHADMSEATAGEWNVLDAWFEKLTGKYPTVGMLRQEAEEELDADDVDEWRTVGRVDSNADEWRMIGSVSVDEVDEWRLVDCQC